MRQQGCVLNVDEVIWQRGKQKMPKKAYIVRSPEYYKNNDRKIIPIDESLTSADFTYEMPLVFRYVPTLIYLRKAEIKEETRKLWGLGDLPVFKVVNGGQGAIAMPHLLAKQDEEKKDMSWNRLKKLEAKASEKTFGFEDRKTIEKTIRAFYSPDRRLYEALDNSVKDKLESDSAKLVRAIALECNKSK